MNNSNQGKKRTVANTVEEALISRRSTRAFLANPINPATIRHILKLASRAPSGSNTQPWKVYVVTGTPRDKLCAELAAAHERSEEHTFEYDYYPRNWREPYLSRRRKTGWSLYGTLGINKGDVAKMHSQLGRNYLFFDAPVGFIFTIDRDMEVGSWLDYGMFLQSIMLAARSFGLDTCPQQAFALYHDIIQRRLSIPPEEMIICGMAIGYADMSAPENTLETEREPVGAFTTFVKALSEVNELF